MIPEYLYKILKHGKLYAVSRSKDLEKTIEYLHRKREYPNTLYWEDKMVGDGCLFGSLRTARGLLKMEQDKERLAQALTNPELWEVIENH